MQEKVENLKEIDEEIKHVQEAIPVLIDVPTINKDEKLNPLSHMQDLVSEAENVREQIYEVADMTNTQMQALDQFDEAIEQLKTSTSSSTTTEMLDCLVSMHKNILIMKENPLTWAILSSFSEKLLSQLPQDGDNQHTHAAKF